MVNQHKFYVTWNSVTTEVFPLGYNGTSLVYEKSNGGVYFRRKLNGKLKFVNNASNGDFTYFKYIEDTDQCNEVQFQIKRYCQGGWINHWNGIFATTEGEWDLDQCHFTIEPRLSDCILSNIQLDIFNIETTYELNAVTFLPGAGTRTYPGARKFSDVLSYLATTTCSNVNGIVSDFFQINPVDATDVNYITGTYNYYKNMYVHALSDIQEPIPTDPASSEKVGFLDVMNDLAVLFDVYWFVDENNNVRIEHRKFFDGAVGMDLTSTTFEKYTKGSNKYKYDLSSWPKYETFTMFESEMGCRFTYEGCGNINKSENEVNYTVQKINTDYFKRIYTPDLVDPKTRGLFLTCVDEPSLQIRGNVQNEELVLARLVLKFHRYSRPQLGATFEYFRSLTEGTNYIMGEYTDRLWGDALILSEKPNKKQVAISIPLCCDIEFNVEDYIKTQMGNGYVDSASLNNKTNMLQLNLAYKVNEDTPLLTPADFIGNGLLCWLDAYQGTHSAMGETYQWDDQSGNGYDFQVPPGLGLGPAITAPGGIPRIRFNSGTMLYPATMMQAFPNKRGTIIIVKKILNGGFLGSDGTILSTAGLGGGNMWDISYKYGAGAWGYYSNILAKYYPGGNAGGNFAGVYGAELIRMFEYVRNQDDSAYIYLNGKPADSSPYNPIYISGGEKNPFTVPNTQPDPYYIRLGNDGVYGSNETIDVFEVIFIDRAVTDVERQQLEYYLAKKWNLNLYTL